MPVLQNSFYLSDIYLNTPTDPRIDFSNPSVWIPLVVFTACCAFMAIVFLQSAVDKVFHFKGNTEWLNSHFASTILKRIVPLLLFILTIFESFSGILTSLGAVFCFTSWGRIIGCIGLSLSLATLLMLLFGQRVAKDYQGAVGLTGYFIVAVAGLFSMVIGVF